jgi:hypothetical protein
MDEHRLSFFDKRAIQQLVSRQGAADDHGYQHVDRGSPAVRRF